MIGGSYILLECKHSSGWSRWPWLLVICMYYSRPWVGLTPGELAPVIQRYRFGLKSSDSPKGRTRRVTDVLSPLEPPASSRVDILGVSVGRCFFEG